VTPLGTESSPTEIIAFGYADETAALRAAEAGARGDSPVRSRAATVIARDQRGNYRVSTRVPPQATERMSVMLADLVFDLIFLVREVVTAATDQESRRQADQPAVVDQRFLHHVRRMLQPGSSALLLVVDTAASDDSLSEAYASHTLLRQRRPQRRTRRPSGRP
jgi:uncharacterized membrane protein